MSFQLHSFGFNAFNQTGHLTIGKTCHKQVNTVLFTSWETTVILDRTYYFIHMQPK